MNVRMKGISLPIEVIVVVAIAVLVLIVVAVFFTAPTVDAQVQIRRQQALDSGCQNLRSSFNCAPNKLIAVSISYQDAGDAAPKPYTLHQICEKLNYDPTSSPNQCYLRCGCPGEPTSAAGCVTDKNTLKCGGDPLKVPVICDDGKTFKCPL